MNEIINYLYNIFAEDIITLIILFLILRKIYNPSKLKIIKKIKILNIKCINNEN